MGSRSTVEASRACGGVRGDGCWAGGRSGLGGVDQLGAGAATRVGWPVEGWVEGVPKDNFRDAEDT